MQSALVLEPLRLAEEEFCLLGDTPETEAWNQYYALLIDEYRAAVLCEDPGWAAERLCEIRKCLGGLKDIDLTCDLSDIAEGMEEELGRGS